MPRERLSHLCVHSPLGRAGRPKAATWTRESLYEDRIGRWTSPDRHEHPRLRSPAIGDDQVRPGDSGCRERRRKRLRTPSAREILGEFVECNDAWSAAGSARVRAGASPGYETCRGRFPVFDLTGLIVLEACRGVSEHQLSYFDARYAHWRARSNPRFSRRTVNCTGRRVEECSSSICYFASFDVAKWA